MFYDSLVIENNRCPPDCGACEVACTEKMRPLGPAILASRVHEVGVSKDAICFQCSEPECMEACPADAIVKNEEDGVVRVIQDNCTGCEQCVDACPYGNMYFSSEIGVAYKCDLCGGEPKCVAACKYNVLTFFKSKTLYRQLNKEDLLSPGNSLCAGCSAELLLRTALKVLGKNTILFWAASCAAPAISGAGSQPGTKIATTSCLMPSIPAYMTGVSRYYRRKGKDYHFVAFAGDGATADIGFQSLSGAGERGENFIYICYDNEAYMNTGTQRSSTTCLGAWTTTTPVGSIGKGKREPPKYIPLLMMFQGVPYVATATPAYLLDYIEKLRKAMAVKNGMAYIHVLSPCHTGWRAPMDSSLELSKMAVQTNYFPLWEAENGQVRFTYTVENPKQIEEFTNLMGRFQHITKEELGELQQLINARISLLKTLSSSEM